MKAASKERSGSRFLTAAILLFTILIALAMGARMWRHFGSLEEPVSASDTGSSSENSDEMTDISGTDNGPVSHFNVYRDFRYNIFFRYPSTYIQASEPGTWTTIFLDNDVKARYWIEFCDASCIHIQQRSLDDYAAAFKENALNKGIPVTQVVTINNVTGIRQDYPVMDGTEAPCKWIAEITADARVGRCEGPDGNGTNYVFFSPTTGFFDLWMNVPPEIENSLLDSLSIGTRP